ncbi:hypothetical protein EB796_000355 [Bugula neritina]|uniref:Uncharacterized protein n=1 Tax=Bugula neritina TaxID=10212 RepID=A0A7J7KT36_BUGNE|nr:hypothetical protein EB796_000355 [Bugula neritina]
MVAIILKYSLEETRTVVKQNGIQIITNFSKAQLTFDFEAKRAVLQLATKPKYVGIGWRQIQELTNDLITQVVNFLSTENFTCKSFCPHCLVEKRVPPFTTTNPNWCTLSTEAQQERQLCNTGMNVPEALLSPRKIYSWHCDFKANLPLKHNRSKFFACLYLIDEEYEHAISTVDGGLGDGEELSTADSSSIESYSPNEADENENEDDGTESVISEAEEWPPPDGIIPFALVPTTKRRIQDCYLNDDVNNVM